MQFHDQRHIPLNLLPHCHLEIMNRMGLGLMVPRRPSTGTYGAVLEATLEYTVGASTRPHLIEVPSSRLQS